MLNYFIKPDFIIELDQEKDNGKIKEIHSLHSEFNILTSSKQKKTRNVFKKDVTKTTELSTEGKIFHCRSSFCVKPERRHILLIKVTN